MTIFKLKSLNILHIFVIKKQIFLTQTNQIPGQTRTRNSSSSGAAGGDAAKGSFLQRISNRFSKRYVDY
jgi:hypothetical protein